MAATVQRWLRRPKSGSRLLEDGTLERTDEYRVELSRPDYNYRAIIMSYRECPTYYLPHPEEPNLSVRQIDIDQLDDAPQVYDAKVTYSTKLSQEDGGQQNGNQFKWIQNPLLRPAIITRAAYTSRQILTHAYVDFPVGTVGGMAEYAIMKGYTSPIRTTAGEPIEYEVDVENAIYTIEKNMSPVLSDLFELGGQWLNSDTVAFRGRRYEPGTLLFCNSSFGPLQIENRVPFITVQFQLALKTLIDNVNAKNGTSLGVTSKSMHARILRNAGFIAMVKDEQGVTRVEPILLGNAPRTYPTSPVPLDDKGFVVPDVFRWLDEQAKNNAAPPLNQDKLDKVWKAATIAVRHHEKTKFTGVLPLQ